MIRDSHTTRPTPDESTVPPRDDTPSADGTDAPALYDAEANPAPDPDPNAKPHARFGDGGAFA